MPGGGGTRDRTAALTSSQAQEERIIKDLRRKRAEEIVMYGSAGSFAACDYWNVHNFGSQVYAKLQSNSWFSQLAFWIQEDIVSSILQLNQGKKNVLEAPIKRLIEISFAGDEASPGTVITGPLGGLGGEARQLAPDAQTMTVAARRDLGNKYRLPSYVLDQNNETVGDLTSAFTQRFCCDLYDVAQFELAVVIDTTAITAFVDTLQSEKSSLFTEPDGSQKTYTRNPITVLQYLIEPLDVQLENEAGYYYGAGSLCTFRLIGEYVFYKNKYYESLKSDPIVQLFVEK